MDAAAVLAGTKMERVSKAMRHLAARYAILRAAVECGMVRLKKVHTDDNTADIHTKPTIGARFEHLRALLLGIPKSPSSTLIAWIL